MKQYTEVFGTIAVSVSIPGNDIHHEIRIEPTEPIIVYPIVPTMSKKQIVTVLKNSKAFREKRVRETMELVAATIANIRTAILEALQEEESLIVDDNYIEHFLPEGLKVSNIGRIDSVENGAFILPKATPVKIVNAVFPIAFEDNAHSIYDVEDYIAQSG